MSLRPDFREINNGAVTLLQCGQIEHSVQELNRALRCLRDSIGEIEVKDAEGRSNHGKSSLFKVQLFPPASFLDSQEHNSVFALYSGAFCFSKADSSSHELNAAAVLYNFGLALHQRGLLQGKNQDLEKALKLYHMSMTVVSEAHPSPQEATMFGLLYLALLTNRGHIHFFHMDTSSTLVCCQRIQAVLNSQEGLGEEEYVFFYANILCGFMSVHRTAPAA